MATRRYTIPKIHCGHCVMTIERELKLVEGVEQVSADEQTKIVEVLAAHDAVWPEVESMLEEIGFPPASP